MLLISGLARHIYVQHGANYAQFKKRMYDNFNESSEEATKASPDRPRLSYYDVLGIPACVPDSQVRRGFRRQAVKFHPDKVGPSEQDAASKMMQLLTEARDFLLSKNRCSYDRSLGCSDAHLAECRKSKQKEASEEFERKSEQRKKDDEDYMARRREFRRQLQEEMDRKERARWEKTWAGKAEKQWKRVVDLALKINRILFFWWH